MGLTLGSQTITLSERYSELRITKDMNGSSAFVELKVETGYYDAGRWRASGSRTIRLADDAVHFLFAMQPSTLGVPEASNLGTTLETAIYGLVGGAIPSRATVTINLSRLGESVPGFIRVRRGPQVVAEFAPGQPQVIPITLGATIEASGPGLVAQSLSVPVLAGTFEHTFTMEPL